ncbi:hypothetical protein [Flavimaricola marinus]|uniref:Uracil DNA glycosylase superfamily protein n=1 Tax=Flavimaricola marinus TaxID=1819565 RepID=A0A238LJV9_9RHOB|nr:hypothetical protein [Flavimaricola marinus]SMY09912.1 hypothetical protein LOM8899_04085 [Flavimaricola marinus]
MDRAHWQELLKQQEHVRGYNDGFKLLFCPWKLLDTADTLFLSPNPGNDPSGEFMRIASDERGNSYLVEREAKHSPMAEQYRKLCDFIDQDPEGVLTGTLMPFRTAKWNPLRDRPNISIARPFWREFLGTGKIKQVFCMGRVVEDAIVELTGARLERQLPANWGNLTIRRYSTTNHVQIYGLLHFSTYKMFGRAECIPQLARLMDLDQAA